MPDRTCSVPGCEKPVRSAYADLCTMHYHRWYRHGDVHRTARTVPAKPQDVRYKLIDRPGHPIAPACGKVAAHRVVLYDHLGPGPHPCHWCGIPLDWSNDAAHRASPTYLEADHLNADKRDNRIGNLAPSCHRCNSGRAVQERSEQLRSAGWWSQNDTRARLTTDGRAKPIQSREHLQITGKL